jgi:translation initiation factor 4G
VTFGSIDDALAPISSSPASAPAVKPAEGVKSFGSVVVQNGVSDSTKSAATNRQPQLSSTPSTSSSQASATSTPPPAQKFSVAKLFQGPSTQLPVPTPEAASPASRSASLPSQAPSQGQPYPPAFAPNVPLRQGQNGNPSAPRSPVYPRMANGQSSVAGVSGRPQAGSGGPSAGPAPPALSSPRLTPHPPPGPPSGLPPPHTMWPNYYVRLLLLRRLDHVSA